MKELEKESLVNGTLNMLGDWLIPVNIGIEELKYIRKEFNNLW
jgi:hypothetical protein